MSSRKLWGLVFLIAAVACAPIAFSGAASGGIAVAAKVLFWACIAVVVLVGASLLGDARHRPVTAATTVPERSDARPR